MQIGRAEAADLIERGAERALELRAAIVDLLLPLAERGIEPIGVVNRVVVSFVAGVELSVDGGMAQV